MERKQTNLEQSMAKLIEDLKKAEAVQKRADRAEKRRPSAENDPKDPSLNPSLNAVDVFKQLEQMKKEHDARFEVIEKNVENIQDSKDRVLPKYAGAGASAG